MSPGRLIAAAPLWLGVALALSCEADPEAPPSPLPAPSCAPDDCGCNGEDCVCDAGLVLCGDQCVDASSNPAHCGACDTVCPSPEQCVDGSCRCPGDPDLRTDVEHCGACGRACPPAHACEGGSCICLPGAVSFAADVQPIFDTRCVDALCHDGIDPKGALDLRPGEAYEALVGIPAFQTGVSCPSQPRVAPGDPEGSYLVAKVRDVGACFGAIMPPKDPLSPEAIETLITWICGGAAEN